MSNVIQELSTFCKEYNETHKTEFKNIEFMVLIMSYPALLVAVADKNFDEYEENLLVDIAVDLLKEISKKEISETQIADFEMKFFSEVVYLSQADSYWKERFLNFLKLFNREELKNVTNTIESMLVKIAKVSDGISDVEQKTIDYITDNFLEKI